MQIVKSSTAITKAAITSRCREIIAICEKNPARDCVLLSRNSPAQQMNAWHCRLSERRLNFGDKWGYAPAPEANDYIRLQTRYSLFINGKFVAPRSGKYFDSINPATEEKLAEIAEANARDVDLAVKSARRAYKKVWSKMPGRERGKYLYPHRAPDPGKIARARRPRDDGWRQNDQGEPRRRSAARRGAFFLLRRLGGQAANTRFPGGRPRRSASRARSFPGISRC